MPTFYYQIKGRLPEELRGTGAFGGNWEWPPLFADKIEAENKAAAKLQIQADYSRIFPQRVMEKDLENQPFLLHITEMEDDNESLQRQFQMRACKQCDLEFRIIDKYNDPMNLDKGADYCSVSCSQEARRQQTKDYELAASGQLPAVIYLVRQISTGKCYVGQTTRPITLRWWQHLTYPSDNKFHQAIKSSPLTDWQFQAIESIALPKDFANKSAYITDRERFWIMHYECIDKGFNTILPSAISAQPESGLHEHAIEELSAF